MQTDSTQPQPPLVHIVSHGPYCLDGVAAAVAVSRYRAGTTIVPHFSGNERINEVLRSINPDAAPPGSELWITDISWTEKETDVHLRSLAAQGVKIYWFDHHRTALKRYAAGEVDVPFADHVVSEEQAAARLVYEYLEKQSAVAGHCDHTFAAFAPVVALADDNDRWIHASPASRELPLTVRTVRAARAGRGGMHASMTV